MTQQSVPLFTDLKPSPPTGSMAEYERQFEEWAALRMNCEGQHAEGCDCQAYNAPPEKPTCGFCSTCGWPAAIDLISCDRCGQSFMVDSVLDDEVAE